MKDILLAATAVGVLYLIWKQQSTKSKCNCEKCSGKLKMPSDKITDDMKVYSLKKRSDVIPEVMYKDFETDTGATVSKNRMRYKFKRSPNDILNANEI